MRLNDQEIGKPTRLYVAAKTSMPTLAAGDEGCMAYATDTNEIGTWNGAAWDWTAGSGSPGATTFLGLTDTPASYSDQRGKAIIVDIDELSLVFSPLPTAHDPVTLNVGHDAALSLTGQELSLADVLTPTEHTNIGNGSPHHAPVTLGAGHDAVLSLSGQELSLADVLTPTEHTSIGDGSPHHAAVTLGAGNDPALSLSGQQLTLSGVLSPVWADPAQITGNQDNYNPGTGNAFRLTSDADRNITGWANPVDGKWLYILNIGTHGIWLLHQSTSSDAANRFICPSDEHALIMGGSGVMLVYDGYVSRWRFFMWR